MSPVSEIRSKQFSQTASGKRTYVLILLLLAGCLTTMTGGVVSPVLPEMVQDLQFDLRWAGMLVSTHALAIALFTPLMGILADRFGKLKVMIPALISYAVFGVMGAFIPNLAILLVTRALLGIASGGITAASIGFLSNMYEGEARSKILGFATSAMTTTSILVPLLGGWVGSTHWQYAFYLYGLGLPVALLAGFSLQGFDSSATSAIANTQGRQLLHLLRKPGILKLYFLLAIAAMIVYSVVIYTPLFLKDAIDAGPELNGMVLAVRGMGAVIASAIAANWLAKTLGAKFAISLGFILMAITLATIPLLHHIQLIMIAAIFFGAGFGIIPPNTYNALANLSPSELRTSVLAIGTGFNSLGQFLCPLLLGHISQYQGLPMVFYATAVIALLTAFVSLMQVPKARPS